uniref:Uncharacterized protein n=1 Tax=Fagus sylvatica TaxID=28930 RepID=A0A2N9FCK0_FAGSY
MVVLSEYVGNLGDDEHGQVHLITVFVAVLCLCLIIGHWLEENRWVNESITAIFTVISLSHSHISGMHSWNSDLASEQREEFSHPYLQ